MRLSFAALLVTSLILMPAAAQATPGTTSSAIKECGTMYGGIYRNITTRVVGCWEARQVIKAWQGLVGRGRYNGNARGMYCRRTKTGYETADVRCTAYGGRVVRWQLGS